MRKILSIVNLLILGLVVFWNYYANAKGINENSVGSLSAEYDNLFTPASYAFSIWGLIYLALIGNAIFQLTAAFRKKKDEFIEKMGPWLMLANIGNGAWIWLWLTERTGWSVVIMILILLCLIKLILNLRIGVQRTTRLEEFWVKLPVGLYVGWITVATVANISAYLAKLNWQFLFSGEVWTIIMLIIATTLYTFVLSQRKMITYTIVGIWAITAIMVRHWGSIASIQWVALGCIVLLVLGVLMKSVKKSNTVIAS